MLRMSGVKTLDGNTISDAKEQLTSTLALVSAQINTLESEVFAALSDIRTRKGVLSKSQLRKMIVHTKLKKGEIKSLQDKSLIMSRQLDSLESNEVNKAVLQTMQTSASALKNMGLQNDLVHADAVISEMEEGINQINDMNSTMSTGISQLDLNISDEDLEEELNILFNDMDGTSAPKRPTPDRDTMNQPKQPVSKDEVVIKMDNVLQDGVSNDAHKIGLNVMGQEEMAA
jgi:Snf7